MNFEQLIVGGLAAFGGAYLLMSIFKPQVFDQTKYKTNNGAFIHAHQDEILKKQSELYAKYINGDNQAGQLLYDRFDVSSIVQPRPV